MQSTFRNNDNTMVLPHTWYQPIFTTFALVTVFFGVIGKQKMHTIDFVVALAVDRILWFLWFAHKLIYSLAVTVLPAPVQHSEVALSKPTLLAAMGQLVWCTVVCLSNGYCGAFHFFCITVAIVTLLASHRNLHLPPLLCCCVSVGLTTFFTWNVGDTSASIVLIMCSSFAPSFPTSCGNRQCCFGVNDKQSHVKADEHLCHWCSPAALADRMPTASVRSTLVRQLQRFHPDTHRIAPDRVPADCREAVHEEAINLNLRK